MPKQQDPFLVVKEDILAQLEHVRTLANNLSQSPSSSTKARDDLQSALSNLRQDIDELDETVMAVEEDPKRYNVGLADIERRKETVSLFRAETDDIVQQAQQATSQYKNGKGGREQNPHQKQYGNTTSSWDNHQTSLDGDDTEFDLERQQQIYQDQDEQLDDVYKTVGSLRNQAKTMGEELEDQAVLLEDFGQQVDQTGDKLKRGIKKVQWFLKKNEDSKSNYCILLLIVVLVILLVLVVLV